MNETLVIVLVMASIPIFIGLAKLYFGSLQGFLDCLGSSATPDVVSATRGEYYEDKASGIKLLIFVGMCAFVVFIEYKIIAWLFL